MEPSADRVRAELDRFSALPTDVAHRILSPFPLADVARVGTLSKGCRAFHLSNPIFNFTDLPPQFRRLFHKRMELLDSLDQFFIHRGNNKIQTFSFNWVCEDQIAEYESARSYAVEKSRVLGLSRKAVSCDVQSLNVFVKPVKLRDSRGNIRKTTIKFPACVFDCESLTSLIVDMTSAVVRTPSSPSSISNIICLKLTNVTVQDDTVFCKWVSVSCRFIKELLLRNVSWLRNVIIQSSSMESFSIECCGSVCHLDISGDKLEGIQIEWRCSSPYGDELKLSAPNLKRLRWVGVLMKNLYMGKLCCLDEVELSFSPCSYCGSSEFRTVRDQLLCSIRSVTVLILDSSTAKVMFEQGFPPNILCLRVSIPRGIDDNVVPELATILKRVPNKLNTLGISSKLASFYSGIDAFGFSRGYWELQGLEFISQLKEVTLELTNGSNGIYLAWYFLEHAQYLKKMTIIYSPELPHHIGFMAKVKRTRIISDAIVIFQEKESDDLELFLLSP